MGIIRLKNDVKWTEELIQDCLRRNFLSFSAKKYEMFGKFVYDWESDYLAITKSGYAYECEIKISRSDFFNDNKKVKKHLILEGKDEEKQRPNYFYYAVPEGLVKPEEIPDDYGLIYVHTGFVNIVKPAKLLHKNKVDVDALNLIDKFYYGMWDYIGKYRRLNTNELKDCKDKIKRLEKELARYDDNLSCANCQIDELKDEIAGLRNMHL